MEIDSIYTETPSEIPLLISHGTHSGILSSIPPEIRLGIPMGIFHSGSFQKLFRNIFRVTFIGSY